MKYSIEKKFYFEAAHRLCHLENNHPCFSDHGHSYVIKLYLETLELDKNGFVIDFNDLKKFGKYLNENFDHSTIISMDDSLLSTKSILPIKLMVIDGVITSEKIAEFLFYEFIKIFPEISIRCNKITITVGETRKNEASVIVHRDEIMKKIRTLVDY